MDREKERKMRENIYDADRMVAEYKNYLKRTTPEERKRDRERFKDT